MGFFSLEQAPCEVHDVVAGDSVSFIYRLGGCAVCVRMYGAILYLPSTCA